MTTAADPVTTRHASSTGSAAVGGVAATVSVVVPTYHRNDLLVGALESVAGQTYGPVEVIVVDGAADARAEPIAAEFDAEYIRQRNHGADSVEGVRAAADARDVGVAAATGKYVHFLDDDDRLRADAIERQVRTMERSSSTGVVYCGIEREGGMVTLPAPSVRGDVLEHALALQVPPCVPSTMLVERRCLTAIPPMRTLPHDDAALRIELARITEFDFVDEPLVVRGTSEDGLAGDLTSVRGRKETIERYAELYERFPSDVRKTALMRAHLQEGQYHIRQHAWSPATIRSFLLASYYAPDLTVELVGSLVASLFGRPGWRLGVAIYNRLMGSERRGQAGDLF